MAAREPEEKLADSSAPDDVTLRDEAMKGTGATEPSAPNDAQDDATRFLSGFKLWVVMAGVTVVVLLAMLDISIIGTAIPQITSDFHRLEDVGWYIGAYQLASATFQPLTGKLLSYFSVKWTFLVFFLIFEVGSVVCGAATSSTMLIIGRAVAGLGASGLINGSLTIIQSACTPQSRPLYIGFALGVGQLGIALGPLLGGVFTQHATWRWCFYINLPLGGLAGLFIILTNIPDQTPKQPPTLPYLRSLLPHFDLTGFALFAPAAIMFLLALHFGAGDYGWNSSEVIGLFCGAAAAAAVFVFWERRMGDDAMIPLPMVRQTVVWASSLNFALLMLSATVGSNFIPIYLQSVKGLSPTMSGTYMLASILPQILFIFLSAALVAKLGYYIAWAFFASVLTTIGCGLISTWEPATGLGKIIGYQVLVGARGAGMQIGVIAVQAALPPKMAAVGNSFIIFSQNMFGAIFISIADTIFQESLSSNIASNVPGISPKAAIAAGGSSEAVRALAPPGPLRDGLLRAYSDSVANVFYLLIATSGAAFLASFGMGWVDWRTKPQPKKGDA